MVLFGPFFIVSFLLLLFFVCLFFGKRKKKKEKLFQNDLNECTFRWFMLKWYRGRKSQDMKHSGILVLVAFCLLTFFFSFRFGFISYHFYEPLKCKIFNYISCYIHNKPLWKSHWIMALKCNVEAAVNFLRRICKSTAFSKAGKHGTSILCSPLHFFISILIALTMLTHFKQKHLSPRTNFIWCHFHQPCQTTALAFI